MLVPNVSNDALGESFAPLVPIMVVPTGAVLLLEGFIGELHLLRREFMRSLGENLSSLERAMATPCAASFLKAPSLESLFLVVW
jgi:hypothetical protein